MSLNEHMKQAITIIFFIMTLILIAQEKNCADFKVGKFTYSDLDYSDLITVRTDSLQIDSYPKMELETKSIVKWITDCKYEIEYIEVNDSKMESLIGTKYTIPYVILSHHTALLNKSMV